MRQHLSLQQRLALVGKFAQMLACTHRARIWHQDMHSDNVLVIHNLPEFDKQKELHFEWRLIDWGCAEDLGATEEVFDAHLEEAQFMLEPLRDMFVSQEFSAARLLEHLHEEYERHFLEKELTPASKKQKKVIL